MTQSTEVLSPGQLESAVDQIIQARKSVKVLGDVENMPQIPDSFFAGVQEAMKVAGWAPFHFTAHDSHLNREMNSPVPWRFYALDQQNCQRLIQALLDHPDTTLSKSSGILRMIAAYGALVLVTWLPEPEGENEQEAARAALKNPEHIAATAAAIQNLLLAATARNIDSYWSSGGALREKACFDICNIPEQERLLGSVFLAPEMFDQDRDVRPGKLRDQRGSPEQWMTAVKI